MSLWRCGKARWLHFFFVLFFPCEGFNWNMWRLKTFPVCLHDVMRCKDGVKKAVVSQTRSGAWLVFVGSGAGNKATSRKQARMKSASHCQDWVLVIRSQLQRPLRYDWGPNFSECLSETGPSFNSCVEAFWAERGVRIRLVGEEAISVFSMRQPTYPHRLINLKSLRYAPVTYSALWC